ncbi:fatty acid desaturase [Mumia flava]|uniref:Fatty acid desaturase n=1 Tax=Mumia flava TaxID=1348852 RepID=A0A2M9BE48_9ACTN|nr:acyl-CoA desaturase [Mumia flava]PJJ56164.1 fatty acid desaturase [Mumia flava]
MTALRENDTPLYDAESTRVYDATDHDMAPEPLVSDDATRTSTVGLDLLTPEELDELGRELDAMRVRLLAELGQEDADYIRRVMKARTALEVVGRGLFFVPFVPGAWLGGVASLSLSKILDNMEIGHNVMHGQYDWMNDPELSSKAFEWDTVGMAKGWKNTHNYVHHTYTNIHGKDRDIGYGLVRIDPDQPWHPAYLGNPVYAMALALLFEWGVLVHDLERDRVTRGEETPEEWKARNAGTLAKIRRQLLKDYVVFPALTGPFFLSTLLGNLSANLVRNVWAFAVIFCGHFPADVESWTEEEAENETRGQWYLRQLHGSANISGGRLFHIMTGNLSHQIEHHLFPDIPSRRYPQIAPEIRAICEKYGLKYNTGPLSRQLGSVAKKITRYALPPRKRGGRGFFDREWTAPHGR